MTSPPYGLPHLGYGIGLRSTHFEEVLTRTPALDWFEIISENFLGTGGRPLYVLDQVAERYPVVMHGVSMSIGSTDPLDMAYLRELRRLADRIGAVWVSDHLCWTGLAHRNSHDLLPLPYHEDSLAHLIERVRVVQDVLERPIGLENPSTYVEFRDSTMTEWEFLRRLAAETGCMLLLDVNNIFVSCENHGWSTAEYLANVPYEQVVQFHLAGHTRKGTHIIDTHSAHVVDEVWALYRQAHALSGGRATLVEWDADIPALDVVHAEVERARRETLSMPDPGSAAPRAGSGSAAPSTDLSSSRSLTLPDLQRWFLQQVTAAAESDTDAATESDAATVTDTAAAADPAPDQVLLPSAHLSAAERLGLHRRMYTTRLVEVLESEHPVVKRLVCAGQGESAFAALVRDYVSVYPSRSYTLSDLAAALPHYLARLSRRADAALLADIARLERAASEARDACSTTTLTAGALATIPPETWGELCFRLDPSIRLLAFAHDACAIVNAHERGEELPDLAPKPSWAVVWRNQYRVWRKPLTRTTFVILSALAAGSSLSAALEAGAQVWERDEAELEERISAWFAEWLAEGFFAAILTRKPLTPPSNL